MPLLLRECFGIDTCFPERADVSDAMQLHDEIHRAMQYERHATKHSVPDHLLWGAIFGNLRVCLHSRIQTSEQVGIESMVQDTDEFSKDLLVGAEAIATYLFGSPNARRKIYHIIATSRFPYAKLGSMICVRKSVLIRWLETQELRHANDNTKADIKIVRTGND